MGNGLPELACAIFPAVVNAGYDLDYFPWKSIEMLKVLHIITNTVTQMQRAIRSPVPQNDT